ncbi:hypothetical protein ACWC09_04040 [Streptomyces sp. NPDC001617]
MSSSFFPGGGRRLHGQFGMLDGRVALPQPGRPVRLADRGSRGHFPRLAEPLDGHRTGLDREPQ